MKYRILSFAFLLGLAVALILNPNHDSRENYEAFINAHPYNQETRTYEEIKSLPKYDRPDLAAQQIFLETMDPVLRRPTPERLLPTINNINLLKGSTKTTSNLWTERGPNNVGGRTRSIFFDPNDSMGKKVWTAGVAGGVWYNNDITSSTSTWHAVNDFWSNMAVSCMAYDPTNTQNFYAGTGEGWFNQSATRGQGIWKSSDGGATWSQISSTSSSSIFYYVQDIDVHPITGDVYACTRGGGVQKSTNGGLSWTQVLSGNATSLDISSNGLIWAAIRSNGIFTSKSGNSNSWTKKTSNNGFNNSNFERIDLAIAPSDTNVCYAIVEVANMVGGIYKTSNGGDTWVSKPEPNDADNNISPDDFSRGQAWFDLCIGVDPNNANILFVGAIDLFKTTNGGNTWQQMSHWTGGYGYQYVHADQHKIAYKPGSSSEVIFANDGGVYYSSDANTIFPAIDDRNKDYNVTQFYSTAVHPASGMDYYLAGSQDNGTQQFSQSGINSTVEVTGGDGAYCFIDQTNPNYQISSYVYNNWRFSNNGGQSFKRLGGDQTGSFINPADYDNNQDILFSARGTGSIKRIFIDGTNNPSKDVMWVSIGSRASAIKVSPYTVASSTIFVGTQSGRVFKITGADGNNEILTEIGSTAFPNGNISCVQLGSSENEIIVTFSNFGVNSVWYTNDGGNSWTSKEGNLPDLPVRWSLINPFDSSEVILATELGVWRTKNFNSSNPSWSSTTANSGLANTVVRMLQLRDADYQVAAATFGRGLFTSNIFNDPNPRAGFGVDKKSICLSETMVLTNTSVNANSYLWTVTPSTFNFINGTNSTSAEPEFTFSANGKYTIQLDASNSLGTNTSFDTVYIGGIELPFEEGFNGNNLINYWAIINNDNDITWKAFDINGNKMVGIPNFDYSNADSGLGPKYDDLISPPLSFKNQSYVHMDFKYAYTTSPGKEDSLGIYISEDCGNTWTLLMMMKENGFNSFRTRNERNSAFGPYSVADWCGYFPGYATCPYVDLSAYTGKENIKIMLRNFSNNGNNLYIDDFSVRSSSIGISEEKETSLKVYPNPARNFINIEIGKTWQQTDIYIVDMAGRIIETVQLNDVAGKPSIRMNVSGLTTGTYIIKASNGIEVLKEIIFVE